VQAGRRGVLGHPAEVRSNRTHASNGSLRSAAEEARFSLMSAGEGEQDAVELVAVELESAAAPKWPSLEPALPYGAQSRQRTGERRRAASALRGSAAASRAQCPRVMSMW
jgi:hypothetical protein